MEDLDKLEKKRRREEWNPKKFEEKMKRGEKEKADGGRAPGGGEGEEGKR